MVSYSKADQKSNSIKTSSGKGVIDGWRNYLYAAVPTSAPHLGVNLSPLETGSLWRDLGGWTLFARWTSNWDCLRETNWWFVIKDSPFDINSLKSKRRYEVRKGCNHFDIKVINAADYSEELYKVAAAAYETYPSSYRPVLNHDQYIIATKTKWTNYYKVYGAFSKDDNTLCGFIALYKKDGYLDFTMMKAMPSQEKNGINAALVNGMLDDNKELLESGVYICDGERSVQHETAFQDYLEKYFGFRKAYCRLHIEFNPKYRMLMKIAFLFRGVLRFFDSVKLVHQMLVVFRMVEISKQNEKGVRCFGD